MKATRNDLSIYIDETEVFYLGFPRFSGSTCDYSTISASCRERIDEALKSAKEIVDRFIADGRENATSIEIKRAFNRNRNKGY